MEERREQIVDFINKEGAISFLQLTIAFPNVSEMTLRNDLKFLDQERRIIRVHGGARSTTMVIGSDVPLHMRTVRNVEKKRQIARKALKFLRPDTSIFLDSGSTTMELAKIFPDDRFLIFSGGIACISELARLSKASIYVLGGKLNQQAFSTFGSQNLQEIERINFGTAFISVTGYCSGKGFSGSVEERCEQKKIVIKKAEQKIVLMDSQKVGLVTTFGICMPTDIDILISDDGLNPAIRDELEACGVEVC